MSRNAAGVMTTATMATAGQPGVSATVNAIIDDIAAELTASLSRDGKGAMRAALLMGGFKALNMAPGVAATDGATVGQIQLNVTNAATSVGGTPDAITAGFTPAITSYATNIALRITATGANTIAAPTVNVDGLGTKVVKKLNGQPLLAGDIAGAGHILVLVYNGTDLMLLNPTSATSFTDANLTGSPTAPTATQFDNDTSVATTAFVNTAMSAYFAVNDQTGTTYTFVVGDAGKLCSGNNASAQTFTVPPNSTAAFPIKSKIDLWQKGAGQLGLAAGAGVTLRSSGAKLKLSAQYAACTLVKIATDEWLVFGDLTT